MSADAGTNMEDEFSTDPYNRLQEDARKQESIESPINYIFSLFPPHPLLIQQAHKFKRCGGGPLK